MKHIFVTGGVVSGLGKGIVAASLGRLLKQRGLKVAAQKLDPYMNIDPGTMNPIQHGEVFVTDDGAESDLDIGHYERFIDENLSKFSNLTSGKVYWSVLNRERSGDYLGKTVQVIPHITNEIKSFIYESARNSGVDVLISEIGGTTGDIESQPFLEAIRQISLERGKENCVFIHVTLVPYIKGSNEHKSKPTQHSVKELRSMGISPDIIVARVDKPMDEDVIKKISLFCNVKLDCVIENLTLDCLYSAPIMLHKNKLDDVVCQNLQLETKPIDLTEWENLMDKIATRNDVVKIAIVGKYIKLHDAYLSVVESLHHAGFDAGCKIDIIWVDCEPITPETAAELLGDVDGILIPGGFGDRGIMGKINACSFARKNNIPYFGICLGMQIAVIEFARNVCGLKEAGSTEFDTNEKCPIPVIDIMEDQKLVTKKGGTMRLGLYPCKVQPNTILKSLYNSDDIEERHRHRYELNNKYLDTLTENGLRVGGIYPDDNLCETIELPQSSHRFFVGVQYHPEFKSRPNKPHPVFLGFVKAAQEYKEEKKKL